MNNIVVHDVSEVFITDDNNDKTYFFGLTSSENVNQTLNQTPIRGGIGNKRVATISSDKDINFDVQTTLHNDAIYEIQSGSLFGTEAITLLKQETVQAVDSSGSITCAITGTPVGDVTVLDKNGKEYVGAFATGKVTITSGVAGQYYTIVYNEAEASANVLDLNSESMPSTYHVQLHTIAYDPDTEEIVADLYWVFSKCLPDGNISAGYKSGENQQDTIKFNCEIPVGSKSYGKYAVIPRI